MSNLITFWFIHKPPHCGFHLNESVNGKIASKFKLQCRGSDVPKQWSDLTHLTHTLASRLPSIKSSIVWARFWIKPRQFFAFDVVAAWVVVVAVVGAAVIRSIFKLLLFISISCWLFAIDSINAFSSSAVPLDCSTFTGKLFVNNAIVFGSQLFDRGADQSKTWRVKMPGVV